MGNLAEKVGKHRLSKPMLNFLMSAKTPKFGEIGGQNRLTSMTNHKVPWLLPPPPPIFHVSWLFHDHFHFPGFAGGPFSAWNQVSSYSDSFLFYFNNQPCSSNKHTMLCIWIHWQYPFIYLYNFHNMRVLLKVYICHKCQNGAWSSLKSLICCQRVAFIVLWSDVFWSRFSIFSLSNVCATFKFMGSKHLQYNKTPGVQSERKNMQHLLIQKFQAKVLKWC